MGTEGSKDPFNGLDWKVVRNDQQKDPDAKVVVKKQLPRKIKPIPECYFLPRRSLPSALAFYGACIAGGVGAGMLLELWMNKIVRGIHLTRLYDVLLIRALIRTSRVFAIPKAPHLIEWITFMLEL